MSQVIPMLSNWPETCPRCGKPMTAQGWATDEGFICSYCLGKQRKQKRLKKKRKKLT